MFRFSHCFILLVFCGSSKIADATKGKKCGQLFLTLNAVHNSLNINWDFTQNCDIYPDTLTLFYKNSELSTPRIDVESIPVQDQPNGYYLTDIRLRKPEFPGNWNEDDARPKMGSHCYPFWLQSSYQGTIIDTVCLKIQPTWMESFGKLKLGEMMIPGTHDSGAWMTKHINLVKKYTFTQEINLWGQLVSGIRYFDIRVGVYKSGLWINHGKVQCSKMEEEFTHIANFLNKSPHEVVILHFHSFEVPRDFKDEDHREVLELLQKVLGEFILPPGKLQTGEGLTLEEVWATKKQLIVSYNDRNQVTKNDWLWNNLPHKWGNKLTVNDLHDYLDEVKDSHSHSSTPFCALISVMTPNAEFILKNPDKSLRHMADEVNSQLSGWIRNGNWSEDINIIATDFFMGNDVVQIALEANCKRLAELN